MTDSELEAAREKLRAHGGYDWLVNGKAFWSVTEVAKALTEAGMPISNDSVTRWFHALPHTQRFSGTSGLRASRNDLIIYFANQMGSFKS
jgi:hypothetical protein